MSRDRLAILPHAVTDLPYYHTLQFPAHFTLSISLSPFPSCDPSPSHSLSLCLLCSLSFTLSLSLSPFPSCESSLSLYHYLSPFSSFPPCLSTYPSFSLYTPLFDSSLSPSFYSFLSLTFSLFLPVYLSIYPSISVYSSLSVISLFLSLEKWPSLH